MKTKKILILFAALFGSYIVSAQCTASFSLYIDAAKKTVYFYDSSYSSGRITNWIWTFGDGTADYSKNPIHKYSGNGAYTVCLKIFDSTTSCSDTTCMSIAIAGSGCKADFSETTDTNYLNYTFVSYSNTTNIIHEWTIAGTKQASTKGNIKYSFASKGTYTVCLKITDTTNKCTDSICRTIVVAPKCYSNFSHSLNGDTLTFVSSYSPSKVRWDFGDGSFDTVAYGRHVYSKAGTYKVCLKVYCSSTDSSETCVTINVGINNTCKADFSVVLDTTQKFKLFLINKSTKSSGTYYYWTFGDSSASTDRNPTHKYSKFGQYLVCLTINDYSGGRLCTSTFCDSLGLDSNGKLLKADGFEIEVIEEGSSGIISLRLENALIYPNPASDELHILLLNSDVLFERFEIMNTQGQLVFSSTIKQNELTKQIDVDTRNLRSGIYFVRLVGTEGFDYFKFIKK